MAPPRRRPRRPPWSALLAVLVVAALAVVVGGATPGSAAAGPVLAPQSASGAPGTTLLVGTQGWPVGTSVTVVLCGNGGRRGSEDCDLVAGQSVEVHGAATEYVLLPLGLPPAPCPCVVRATDVTSTVVVTAPFDLVGAPTAPTVGPTTAAAPVPIAVAARVRQVRGSFVDRLRRTLGGPSHRRLVLELRNTSSAPVTGVVVTAALGRSATGGEPLDAPPAFDLAVGEARTVTLPVELEAPVHGRFVVAGNAFAAGRSVPFAVELEATPWGLLVLALLLAVAVATAAGLLVRRRQEQARRRSDDEGERPETPPGTLGEQALQDRDPALPLS